MADREIAKRPPRGMSSISHGLVPGDSTFISLKAVTTDIDTSEAFFTDGDAVDGEVYIANCPSFLLAWDIASFTASVTYITFRVYFADESKGVYYIWTHWDLSAAEMVLANYRIPASLPLEGCISIPNPGAHWVKIAGISTGAKQEALVNVSISRNLMFTSEIVTIT